MNHGRGQAARVAAGVLLAAVAVAAVLLALTSGGGTSGAPRHEGSAHFTDVAIPQPTERNLRLAVAAAGCVLLNPASEGRQHVTGTVVYRTNPPSSGPHYPTPAHDGIYDPGATPPKERLVHSLEHGRIEIQYRPGTPTAVIGALQSLTKEFARRDDDPRTLLFQNETGMPFEVAAVAWTHILGCRSYDVRVIDAIRDFRRAYDLKGPEPFFVDAE